MREIKTKECKHEDQRGLVIPAQHAVNVKCKKCGAVLMFPSSKTDVIFMGEGEIGSGGTIILNDIIAKAVSQRNFNLSFN